jgi:WS/DGAT/MGAT family acyltransferase
MWRLGLHDARLRPVVTVVAVLGSSPGIDAVAHRGAALARLAPRFGARIAPPVTPLGPPRLVPDEQFDLSAHIRVVAAPGRGTLDDVLWLAGPLAAEGLDPSRPLWHLTLVEGMAGGRAALVVRLHHCLSDGVGLLDLASVLFGDPSGLAPGAGPGGSGGGSAGGGWSGGLGAAVGSLVDDIRREADLGVSLVRRALPAAAGLVRAAGASQHPHGEADRVGGYARSVVTALAGESAPCSPLMTGRSASAVFSALSLDLEAVRRAGRSEEATVNDVFVAAVLDGLGRYHEKHRSHPAALRLAVPVDLRNGSAGNGSVGSGSVGSGSGGNGSGGNHFFPARVLAPLQIRDRALRLRAVHDLVAAARRDPAIDAYGPVAAVAARLPGAESLAARALMGVDVIASNVAGSPVPLDLAGSELQQLVPFGPRSGAGCNITTLSYAGTLHVGVNLDPAATPDTGTLIACLSDAFADAVISR